MKLDYLKPPQLTNTYINSLKDQRKWSKFSLNQILSSISTYQTPNAPVDGFSQKLLENITRFSKNKLLNSNNNLSKITVDKSQRMLMLNQTQQKIRNLLKI